jgi:hypothetical protein
MGFAATDRTTKWAAAKTAMNLLSYEARAAVHRCDSHAWMTLIPDLGNKYNLSLETARFLHLMHTERISESKSPAMNFHLFQGHLFALHPGMSSLMQTRTGQQLLGEFLQASTAKKQAKPLQRLLMGIYLSLLCHTGRLHDQRQRRQRHPRSNAGDAIDVIRSTSSRDPELETDKTIDRLDREIAGE